ncbi:MAG: aminodeoxychorismate lyase [Methylococcaceae bacterium]|jgi:4-amino-4-deoxychorismate lyase
MLVNGEQFKTIAIMDRGFQYGDGLFETIEVRQNTPIFLEQHLQRLSKDSQRLLLPKLDFDLLRSEISELCQNAGNAVLKIIITRGSGGRGYRQPDMIQPTRILSLHPFPDYPQSYYVDGVVARICKTRLGLNPTLAGMKHLNRLEQVLARAEWNDIAIQEGIMLDFNERVIEGTMTNLFYAKNGELFTASLKNCGISGIIRAWIFEQMPVIEHDFFIDDLRQADEIFVCNSVIGIWGIRELENKHYAVGEITKKLQFALESAKQKQVSYAIK